jgi:hypothetical protein
MQVCCAVDWLGYTYLNNEVNEVGVSEVCALLEYLPAILCFQLNLPL